MQIQVHTDNHIQGSEALTQRVEAIVEDVLGRFGNRITRVEVHLTDENSSSKTGENDMRCMIEARLAGLQPIVASDQSASLEQAINGAVDKLERTLARSLGRQEDR